MATTPDASAAVSPVRDPIRIVPLHLPGELLAPLDAAAPASAPHLSYRGGPLLTSVKVFTVYWGAGWGSAPLADLASKLDGFFDFVLTSELMDQMGDYSVAGKTIGQGSRVGRTVLTSPAPKTVVTDAGIQHLLRQRLADPTSGFPAADVNTLYFVYLPPVPRWCRAGHDRVRRSAATTATSAGRSFMPRCPIPAAPAAPVVSRSLTR